MEIKDIKDKIIVLLEDLNEIVSPIVNRYNIGGCVIDPISRNIIKGKVAKIEKSYDDLSFFVKAFVKTMVLPKTKEKIVIKKHTPEDKFKDLINDTNNTVVNANIKEHITNLKNQILIYENLVKDDDIKNLILELEGKSDKSQIIKGPKGPISDERYKKLKNLLKSAYTTLFNVRSFFEKFSIVIKNTLNQSYVKENTDIKTLLFNIDNSMTNCITHIEFHEGLISRKTNQQTILTILVILNTFIKTS
ncbi:MAG: hypothetical protein RsTaC01_0882 [Candidatus Paraimprobicoccus trichonymphae]|uniref:Uncharacterized protein n=1 Tax=Candidatus Paraimprobicoccus trichonymphae TaxID=3033793 RepID=A0AA48L043_9FIRM|nr:MAG: hypothetical protein RsTaC01_0882 [Candidatus Paraimprobicoccus trichonymphae]